MLIVRKWKTTTICTPQTATVMMATTTTMMKMMLTNTIKFDDDDCHVSSEIDKKKRQITLTGATHRKEKNPSCNHSRLKKRKENSFLAFYGQSVMKGMLRKANHWSTNHGQKSRTPSG